MFLTDKSQLWSTVCRHNAPHVLLLYDNTSVTFLCVNDITYDDLSVDGITHKTDDTTDEPADPLNRIAYHPGGFQSLR